MSYCVCVCVCVCVCARSKSAGRKLTDVTALPFCSVMVSSVLFVMDVKLSVEREVTNKQKLIS